MTAEKILSNKLTRMPGRAGTLIWEKIEAISHELRLQSEARIGLMDGRAGIALFFARHHRLTRSSDSMIKVQLLADECIDYLRGDDHSYSFQSGLMGVAWTVHYMADQQLIDRPGERLWQDIDQSALDFTMMELNRNNYDVFQGGLGSVPYLLARCPNPEVEKMIVIIVDKLYALADADEYGVRWKDFHAPTGVGFPKDPVYNLGLAHGIPSIISILCMIHKKGIAKQKTKELIDNSIDWVIKQKNRATEAISVFPEYVSLQGKKIAKDSALSWYSGDLGIAIALANAGRTLNKKLYNDLAVRIFLHNRMSRAGESGLVDNTSICHGSTGISHLYRRMFAVSGEPWLHHEADRWLERTFSALSNDNIPEDLRHVICGNDVNRHTVMEGLAGIGLALMSAVDAKDSSWDRCLLIS